MLQLTAAIIATLLAQPELAPSALSTELPATAEPAPAPCEILWPDNIGRDAFIAETWPDGIVPYEFDANVIEFYRARSIEVMQEIMSVSNVRFVPRTTENDRILITDSTVNNSFVGRIGGAQRINIVSWSSRYTIAHELMHALGTWHEQQRPDRDKFVQINHENIQPGREGNFNIRVAVEPAGPYDFGSVMHYPEWAFSSNGMPTITVLPPNESQQSEIGQLNRLSEGDILGLTTRYGRHPLGDLTGENIVDETDLSILLAAWGTPNLDLDGDGICGASDLAILLADWN